MSFLKKGMVKIEIPHNLNPVCCMVSGIDDQYFWKSGEKLPTYYLFWASGMCSFAYIKNKKALPPRMIFFGVNPKSQYENLKAILNIRYEKVEKKPYNYLLSRIHSYIDTHFPVILGPLDMYFLPYSKFYLAAHIPIHYVMATGYDEEKKEVLIYDCDQENPQTVSYKLLKNAFNVKVPGVGYKNTLHVFFWPETIPSPKEIAEKSLRLKIDFMLKPPLSNLGILGMKKLAHELPGWRNELTEEEIRSSFKQMLHFMDDRFEDKNYNGGRFRYAEEYIRRTFELLDKKELLTVISDYKKSGQILEEIARHIICRESYDLLFVASKFYEVSEVEEKLYLKLREIIEFC